jgi:hypothetical protein
MSSAHVTIVVVTVVASTIVDRSLPHHTRRCLQPLQTLGCWSASRPLPPIDRITADGTLRPRRLSKRLSGPSVCRPRLGFMPQPGCTGGRFLIMGPRGGGGGRRRRWTLMDLGGHRPCTRVVDPPDSEDLRWSTRPTPKDHMCLRTTTPPASSSPSLVAPHASAPPSTKVSLSGSGTSSDLKSPCGNWVLRQFARFTTPTGKGRAPGSWDSMVGPSHWAALEEGEWCRGRRRKCVWFSAEEGHQRQSKWGEWGGGVDPAIADWVRPARSLERAERRRVVAAVSSGVWLGLTLTTARGTDQILYPLAPLNPNDRGPNLPHGTLDRAIPYGVRPRPHAPVGRPNQ